MANTFSIMSSSEQDENCNSEKNFIPGASYCYGWGFLSFYTPSPWLETASLARRLLQSGQELRARVSKMEEGTLGRE